MATISRLSVSLTANPKGFNKGLKSAERNLTGFSRSVGAIGAGIAGILTGIGITVLARDLVSVNAKFQTLKSSLKTVTGSAEAAKTAFSLIEKFAVNTPFNLDQVVSAFIKLKARGLDPSERALSAYGNTSSALGKTLDQMIEAVGDATTGQFERLREFNILTSKEGDKITFTYAGVATTVKNTASEIEGYLIGLGENRFGTAMSDQMKNLNPAFSNFGAAVNKLQLAVGEGGLNETIAELTTKTTAWLNSLDADMIAMFTKKTIGFLGDILETVDFITDSIARTIQIFEGTLPGAGQLPGGSPDYKLGDFNKSQQTFDDWARSVRGQGDEQVDEQKKTNELLEIITQKSSGAAVAQ